jgi:CheY-like chemotaxis protein/AraC-like DNA-binding protein
MEDIIENLIGNALKFTPDGGKVIIRLGIHNPDESDVLQKYGSLAEISIQDTGIGIQSSEIERIFDRFYQVDSSHTRRHEGAGIGLTLVNELVKLHHGTITVQSRPGKGTVFAILIPRGRHHLSEDEIVPVDETSKTFVPGMEGVARDKLPVKRMSDISLEKANTLLPLILVVEDNPDMRHYITHNLDHQFIFIEAGHGMHGFSKATETIPDLIITDLMMPGMDGYEFCRKIRKDERTRHIPIIMLTAKAGKKNLISGYECGVDDYVIKPFDREILLTRIHNLLQQRKLLREKFTKQWIRSGVEISASSTDDKFIKKINEILEKHYINPGFGSRLFIKEVGLSRSALYRKLKAISNLSPNTYIRNFRLIKAYQIISLGESDVSSAAYATGFNNLSYFSRSFKQLFKKSPHDFYAHDKV